MDYPLHELTAIDKGFGIQKLTETASNDETHHD